MDNSWGKQINYRKIFKGKTGKWDVQKGFEKLEHIPGDLEVHIHAYGCAHAQEKPEVFSLSAWLISVQTGYGG